LSNLSLRQALQKVDRYSKIVSMEKEIKCPKCGRTEKVKNGFNRGKQRYKCKNCGCNYTGSSREYLDALRHKRR